MHSKNVIKSQIDFINAIKLRLKPSESLVHEMADLLEISPDSAYRRIRSEKKLTYDEIYLLCNRFHLSFDETNHINGKSNGFSFASHSTKKIDDVKSFLQIINNEFEQLRHKPDRLAIITCNEVPFVRAFKYPRLTAFLLSERIGLDTKEIISIENEHFTINDEIKELTYGIAKLYHSTPSVEIWMPNIIDTLARSIENYSAMEPQKNLFCQELFDELIDLLEDVKTSIGIPNMSNGFNSNYKFYLNEFNFNSNYIYFYSSDYKAVYLRIFENNYIVSSSPEIAIEAETCLHMLINKSTLYKNINHQTCSLFFKKQKELILSYKNRLQNFSKSVAYYFYMCPFIHRTVHFLEEFYPEVYKSHVYFEKLIHI